MSESERERDVGSQSKWSLFQKKVEGAVMELVRGTEPFLYIPQNCAVHVYIHELVTKLESASVFFTKMKEKTRCSSFLLIVRFLTLGVSGSLEVRKETFCFLCKLEL